MGIELLEIGVKVKKGVIFTIRGCYRSVLNHPFLVGVLCFLIFLYRLSPFVFHLLVSASPILVCTAVLLGTILSFGQPNLPEIEVEEKTTVEAVSIRTGVLGETAVVEKSESYYVERLSERSWDEKEQSGEGKLGEVRREDSDDTAPLIEERSPGTEVNDGEIWEGKRELGGLSYEHKTDWIEERLGNGEILENHNASAAKVNDGEIWEGSRELGGLGYEQKADWIEERLGSGDIIENHYASVAKVNDEHVGSDDEKSEADSFDSEKVNVDSLDSPPHSPWGRAEVPEDEVEGDDGDDEEEEEEEDASDSGSSRAESSSPDASMADILPMLDELHPLLDEEAPQTVHRSLGDSDEASEKSARSGATGHESDESENQEDLEGADDDNDDGDDEDDLQENKEEERKSPIAWTEEDQKNLMDLGSSEIERNQRLENLILRRRARKMFADRNLIDLDSVDLPFDIAPISTRRQNPFDLAHDYYDDSGLPPIPGSAPSVMLQRRNPFDIPYDSSEEKPDLMGDGFKEEFTTSQPREPFFRRHESFNLGPSNFAPKRKEVKMRPYFIPEGSISEESSSSFFQRQSSELSESKLSSVPDTESISSVTSVEDPEDRKQLEEDYLPEVEVISRTNEVSEELLSGDSELISQRGIYSEEELHREPGMINTMESVSEHVGHGSQSSEDGESLKLGQVEKRDAEVSELESQLEYERRSLTQHTEVESTEYHSNNEAVEGRRTRDSSSSSLSEVSERIFTMTEGEGLPVLERGDDDVADEPQVSIETSVGSTALNISSLLVNDIPHGAPVYDTSPREVSNNVSSSSIPPDVHPELDLGSLPVVDKSSIERECEVSSLTTEAGLPCNVEMLHDTSVAQSVDESSPVDDVDLVEHDRRSTDLYRVEERSFGENSSFPTGVSSHTVLSELSEEVLVEEHLMEQHRWEESHVSNANIHIHTMERSAEDNYSLLSRDSPVEVNELPFEGELRVEHAVGTEATAQSPKSAADVHCEAAEELTPATSSELSTSLFHDEAIHEPTVFTHLDEVQESSTSVESFVADQATQKLDVPEVQELDYISPNVNSPSSPDFVVISPIAIEATTAHVDTQIIVEEVDEIKEIDDAMLSELDSVGDFNIIQMGSDATAFEKHADSVGGPLSSPRQAETSVMRDFDVHSREANEMEDALPSKDLTEHDVYEEDVERISELQTSKTSRADIIEVSREFENDSRDSPNQETLGEEALFVETRVQPGHPLANQNDEDEVRPVENVDAASLEKGELSSVGTEIIGGGAEVSSQCQVDTVITSGMPDLEASTIEEIDLAFEQIIVEEIEKSVDLEPPQAELHNREEVVSDLPVAEVHSIKDVDLEFMEISSKEIEPVVLETPQAELHSAIPESDVQSGEHVDTISEKAQLTDMGTEIMGRSTELSVQVQADTNTSPRMPELIASRIEGIVLPFKQISSEDIKEPVDSESPQVELRNYDVKSTEDVGAAPEKSELILMELESDTIVEDGEVSSPGQVHTHTTSGMTELEASRVEDIDLAFKQFISTEIEKTVVLEPTQAGPDNHDDIVSGVPESEVLSIEDDDVPNKAEFTSAVAENMVGGGELSQVDMDTNSGMTELEARTIEDIGLAFQQISSKEIEKPVVLETAQAELAVEETTGGNSKDDRDSIVMTSSQETSLREVGLIKDSTLDHDSVDSTLHVTESAGTQGASSELHVVESFPSEDTILPSKQVLDGETTKQHKINSDDVSAEVKGDKLGPSEELSVKQTSTFPYDKPEHGDEATDKSHSPSSVKGKGKLSKSSSSSSSSSSDSSSSDSDE